MDLCKCVCVCVNVRVRCVVGCASGAGPRAAGLFVGHLLSHRGLFLYQSRLRQDKCRLINHTFSRCQRDSCTGAVAERQHGAPPPHTNCKEVPNAHTQTHTQTHTDTDAHTQTKSYNSLMVISADRWELLLSCSYFNGLLEM